MQELLIDVDNENKKILLVENGKLIEKYEENPGRDRLEGNIFLGIVENILPGMQAAFVNIGKEKNTFIHIRDVVPKISEVTGNKNENFGDYNIKDYLKVGMPIMVQVKKDSTNKKGARISMHISIPGRFIVLIPNEKFITLSQKIDNKEEREKLLSIVKENMPEGYGAIIRTSAMSKEKEEIITDIKRTVEAYKDVEQAFEKAKQQKNLQPKMIYKSENVVQRLLTDLMDQDLYRICTNDEKEYNEISKRLKEANKTIKLEMQANILDMYNIKNQIEE